MRYASNAVKERFDSNNRDLFRIAINSSTCFHPENLAGCGTPPFPAIVKEFQDTGKSHQIPTSLKQDLRYSPEHRLYQIFECIAAKLRPRSSFQNLPLNLQK
jgi:hypothetical protein